jgi:prepilin-type processing-associated H-X9-DG protein
VKKAAESGPAPVLSALFDVNPLSSDMRVKIRVPSLQFLIVAVVALFLLSFFAGFVYLVVDGRSHSRELKCQGDMAWLGSSILEYHELYGHLPPAHVDASDGARLHSWRALVKNLYGSELGPRRYDFREPKQRGVCPPPATSVCAATERENRLTNFFVVDGPNTPFPGSRTRSIANNEDVKGLANTILTAEAVGLHIEWLEPRDLEYGEMSLRLNDPSAPSISSVHNGGANVGMADGSIRFLNQDVSPDALRAMINIQRGAWRDNMAGK